MNTHQKDTVMDIDALIEKLINLKHFYPYAKLLHTDGVTALTPVIDLDEFTSKHFLTFITKND